MSTASLRLIAITAALLAMSGVAPAIAAPAAPADSWTPPGHSDRCLLPGTSQITENCHEAQGYGIVTAFPLPRERPDTCEYDARHRLLLPDETRVRLPDECIGALGGYPTRAAGWAAAVGKALKATQKADLTPPAPKVSQTLPEHPAAPAPATAEAPRCGTLFGHPPNDGLGQPINELLCDIRGAIFVTFIWPHAFGGIAEGGDSHVVAAVNKKELTK